MATIKSYTDNSQSKKLAEILPIESADMCYLREDGKAKTMSPSEISEILNVSKPQVIPCWSLAALLDVLPKKINHETLFIETSPALWHVGYRDVYIVRADNPVDACYELILKLNELNLLCIKRKCVYLV